MEVDHTASPLWKLLDGAEVRICGHGPDHGYDTDEDEYIFTERVCEALGNKGVLIEGLMVEGLPLPQMIRVPVGFVRRDVFSAWLHYPDFELRETLVPGEWEIFDWDAQDTFRVKLPEQIKEIFAPGYVKSRRLGRRA